MNILHIIINFMISIFSNLITAKLLTPQSLPINKQHYKKVEPPSFSKIRNYTANERLQTIIDLMNVKKSFKKYNAAKIAHIMGFSSPERIENYLKENSHPSFSILEKFSILFGVNLEWLQFGYGEPYEAMGEYQCDAINYFDKILDLKPKEIYFVQSKTPERKTLIALKITDYNYLISPEYWHISSHVGGGGSRQIFSLYRLLLKLKKTKFEYRFWGHIIPDKDFNRLLNGEVFPATLLENPRTRSHWAEDFIDVEHQYPIAKNYSEHYGIEFIKAQKIVLDFKEQYPILA